MKSSYVLEIQALRGIAVILVFLFHLNQELFTYGFLGVDIFFVISGFVISKIIYEKSVNGNFVFKSFFVSRILRLIPALFFMVLIVSFLIILTYEFQANPDTQINTGLLSLFGLSNFYLLFIKNDYFNSFDENVFEHTWSLAIEFQFYLIFPFFLFYLYKFFKNRTNLYLISLTIIVIFFLIYNLAYYSEFFYNTEFRIWELFIGSITFFLFKKKIFRNDLIIILSLIFFAIFFYTKDIFYLIIFICLFTSSIILNFSNFYYLKLILNNKILCYMGDISYSLYLWHLPVIFFSNTFFVDLDYYFFSIVFSLFFSITSFYFIEKPLRSNHVIKKFFLTNVLTLKKTIFVISSMILVLFYIDSQNLRNQILDNQSNYYKKISSFFKLFNSEDINFSNNKDLTCHEIYNLDILKENCLKKNKSNTLIYFFGDSSMHDYYYSFSSLISEFDQLFTSYNNSSFWKPIFKPPNKDIKKKIISFSEKYDQTFLLLSFNHKRNHDLLNKKDTYFINQEQIYLKFFSSLPKNVKIIFIKDTPHFKYGVKQCYLLLRHSLSFFVDNKNESKCDHPRKNILKKMKNIDKMFNNLDKLDNLNVVDLDSYFCEAKTCTFFKNIDSRNIPKKVDGTHLTSAISKNIATFFIKKLSTHIENK